MGDRQGEAGRKEEPAQLPPRFVALLAEIALQAGMIAGGADRGEDRLPVEPLRVEDDAGPILGKVDLNVRHPFELTQFLLDPLGAAGAVHAGDGKGEPPLSLRESPDRA